MAWMSTSRASWKREEACRAPYCHGDNKLVGVIVNVKIRWQSLNGMAKIRKVRRVLRQVRDEARQVRSEARQVRKEARQQVREQAGAVRAQAGAVREQAAAVREPAGAIRGAIRRGRRELRRRRSPELARQEIMDAAERVFVEFQPDQVGLKDVAREAGVSHALITHYFGTFANMIEAVLERRVGGLRARILEKLRDTQGVLSRPGEL